jgi:hypothetical protein
MTLLIPGGLEEGLDLNHCVILELGRQFVKEAYHPLEFFVRGLEENQMYVLGMLELLNFARHTKDVNESGPKKLIPASKATLIRYGCISVQKVLRRTKEPLINNLTI